MTRMKTGAGWIARTIFLSTFVSMPVRAEDLSLDELKRLSFHDLMDVSVSVTSKSRATIREAAGVVTLVTRDQIRSSGARDLLDVLRLIPGVQFGVDVEGVVGIALRGLWAHEGKVLLLWNGHLMNELLFSTTQFGNHFPVDQIARIEMIRGPGSVLYGGFAELGVINIITKQGGDLKGGEASVVYGQTAKDYARRTARLAYGDKFSDLEYSASAFIGEGKRSSNTFTDFSGSTYNMAPDSAVNPGMISGDVAYKGLVASVLYDRYYQTQRGDVGVNLSDGAPGVFSSSSASLGYEWKATDVWSFTPRVMYTSQEPWKERLLAAGDNDPYKREVSRITTELNSRYRAAEYLQLLVGVVHYQDRAVDKIGGTFSNGRDTIGYQDIAFLGEADIAVADFNVSLGGRYEDHEAFDPHFLPRASVTRSFDTFHFKVLLASAFRLPSIENIEGNQLLLSAEGAQVRAIQSERTRVFEIEAGYKLSDATYLTANVFRGRISDPIVYAVDPASGQDGYLNYGKVGSNGAEFHLQSKGEHSETKIGYSYYQRSGDTNAQPFTVPGHRKHLLGLAPHKFTGVHNWRLSNSLSLNATLDVIGKRYGYVVDETSLEKGEGRLSGIGLQALGDIFLRWDTHCVHNLSIGAGVYNAFNQNFRFVQPYNGGHAPLPGLSREYLLRIDYRF